VVLAISAAALSSEPLVGKLKVLAGLLSIVLFAFYLSICVFFALSIASIVPDYGEGMGFALVIVVLPAAALSILLNKWSKH